MIENKKVTTILEALNFCKENHCTLEFRNGFKTATEYVPEHVVVSLGLNLKTVGNDIIEAVNRLIEMYHIPPVKYKTLPWWNELKKYYIF